MSDRNSEQPELVFEGKYLRLLRRGHWLYADRPGITAIVAIAAVTENDEVILIEQYRPPLDRVVIELPAGLVGDTPGAPNEDVVTAARRELLEETGYDTADMKIVAAGPPSAGLSSEVVTLLLATGAKRIEAGGGVDGEEIRTHLVPRKSLRTWLDQQVAAGRMIDLKVYAVLHLL